MKKLIAILLAALMVLGMTTAAMADTQTGNPSSETQTMPAGQQNTVKIKKVYKLTGDAATAKSPEETVAFTFANESVENAGVDSTGAPYTVDTMPELVSVTLAKYNEGAATAAGSEAYLEVVLPAYDAVGIYSYTITETDGNMAGVTYGAASNPIRLVVTVTQGTDGLLLIAAIHTEATGETTKSDSFTNEYKAGKLEVSKTVTGNMGDKNKYFDFKVTFTAPSGDTVGAAISISGGTETSNPTTIAKDWTGSIEVTFKLKDDETLTFANIPEGVTYKVEELNPKADGYNENADAADFTKEGTIEGNATATAAFTNDKTTPIDTGIVLDSLPYILIAVAVAAAVVLMSLKKRRVED